MKKGTLTCEDYGVLTIARRCSLRRPKQKNY